MLELADESIKPAIMTVQVFEAKQEHASQGVDILALQCLSMVSAPYYLCSSHGGVDLVKFEYSLNTAELQNHSTGVVTFPQLLLVVEFKTFCLYINSYLDNIYLENLPLCFLHPNSAHFKFLGLEVCSFSSVHSDLFILLPSLMISFAN